MNPAKLRKFSERRTGDAYYTPDDVAFRCALLLVHDISGATVLDPQVGGGSWARAARELGAARVVGMDIDPADSALDACDEVAIADSLTDDRAKIGQEWDRPDVILMNPPFRGILGFLDAEIRRPKVLGALVPLATLASESRREWWLQHPPAEVHVLSRRPSFTEDGKTDGRDYAFVIWRADGGADGACKIGWIGGGL